MIYIYIYILIIMYMHDIYIYIYLVQGLDYDVEQAGSFIAAGCIECGHRVFLMDG